MDINVINSILNHVREDSRQVSIIGVVDEPKGTQQESDHPDFEIEWVDQHCQWEDDYYGQMYFPVDGKYIVVDFVC
jgi:hypothetical protein